MICAVIGSTKIAEVHVNELVKNNVKQITIISRSKKKRDFLISQFNSRYRLKKIIFESANMNVLKKTYFDLIVICTNNNTPHHYLDHIENSKTTLIIEKPIISLIIFNGYYKSYLDKIYNKFNKLLVCNPMSYFAESIKKYTKKKQKKLQELEFIMKTGGRYTYKDIFINLMPHVLSFVNEFLNLSKFPIKLDRNKSIQNKHYYKLVMNSKNYKIKAYISEQKRKNTKIIVKYNNQKFIRITKNKLLKFKNFLKINKELISIENPMSQFYYDFFQNRKKKLFFKKNKVLTYNLMKENLKLLRSL